MYKVGDVIVHIPHLEISDRWFNKRLRLIKIINDYSDVFELLDIVDGYPNTTITLHKSRGYYQKYTKLVSKRSNHLPRWF